MNNGFQRWGILLGVGLVIVVLDQITKTLVMHTMHLHESIPVIAGFFNLTYIRNPGAAFGMFATTNSAFRLIFFAGTSIFALGLLGTIFYRMHPADVCGQLSVASIFGGAIGNLLDRLQYGEVVDFLDFYMGGHHWPAFNVADSAISVGVVSLLILFAMDNKKGQPAPAAPIEEGSPNDKEKGTSHDL